MLSLPRLFEILCKAVLEELGYALAPNSEADWGADIRAEQGGKTILAEVKWTHRPMVYARRLRDWVPTAAKIQAKPHETISLIVSGLVDRESRAWAEADYGIAIWDRNDLLERAASEHTRRILEAFFAVSDDQPVSMLEPDKRTALEKSIASYIQDRDLSTPEKRPGDKLIGRLLQMPSGNAYATAYEELCVEIINFLFGHTLVNPVPQSRTEDDLDIRDIVYRVSPLGTSAFWQAISRDFRARVIVFECKNYSDAIGPMQVHTTERYMSLRALRPICFILTREKPKQNAFLAAQSAMRDTGKLIVFADNQDLVRMLQLRAAQLSHEPGTDGWIETDPAEILDKKIYDLLAAMPR